MTGTRPRAQTDGLVGCTVATSSHLAAAEVVAESWRRLHADAPFRILLADVDAGSVPPGDESLLSPADVGLDATELRIRRTIYHAWEYATSLKPVLVRHLLRQGAEVVVFTDADTDLHAPLDALAEQAAEAGVCLTPHVLSPLPADGRGPDEMHLLAHGVVNTGLVAVGRGGAPFVDWWTARTRRDSLGLPGDGFLLDQRWADLAPTQFGARLVDDPGLNVAFWNLHERRLERSGGRWTVNGVALRHFHFSGFDPEDPLTLTHHALALPHRVALGDVPQAVPLLREYADRVLSAGQRRLRAAGGGFDATAAGRALAPRDRLLLREAVLAHEAGAAPAPPDPFDPAQSAAFAEFAGSPVARLPLSPQARARMRRVDRLSPDPGHMGRADRLALRLPRAAVRHLGIPFHGLAAPSAAVLAEYGRRAAGPH
ncbi:MAG TPA: hypothetical protein VHB30_10435 [Solirubrobacteraceae bacterium]|nr:hypothetical protein [Solirubrobacteraceae bacterium]